MRFQRPSTVQMLNLRVARRDQNARQPIQRADGKTGGGRWAVLRLLLVWGMFVLFPSAASAQTEVNAHITTDTVWNTDDSPYLVTADINVGAPADDGTTVTLTVEAGVEVRFQTGTGLYIGHNDLWNDQYQGALIAVGGELDADRILFTSATTPQAVGDWKGISFGGSTDSDTSVLDYVTVQYGGGEGWSSGNLSVLSASPTIAHSSFRDGDGYGLYLEGSSSHVTQCTFQHNSIGMLIDDSSPTLEQNTVTDNEEVGIEIGHSSNVIIRNDNEISQHAWDGIYVWESFDVIIQGNRISENGYGLYLEDASGTVSGNTIDGSEEDGIAIEDSPSMQIAGNTISDSGRTPISADAVSVVSIGDNSLSF